MYHILEYTFTHVEVSNLYSYNARLGHKTFLVYTRLQSLCTTFIMRKGESVLYLWTKDHQCLNWPMGSQRSRTTTIPDGQLANTWSAISAPGVFGSRRKSCDFPVTNNNLRLTCEWQQSGTGNRQARKSNQVNVHVCYPHVTDLYPSSQSSQPTYYRCLATEATMPPQSSVVVYSWMYMY